MPKGAGALLFVNVEEERSKYWEAVHDVQLTPSENRGLSFCDSLVTLEEVDGRGMWLIGLNSSVEVNILLI